MGGLVKVFWQEAYKRIFLRDKQKQDREDQTGGTI